LMKEVKTEFFVTAFSETSNVLTLSTAGMRSPPSSVASFILLQEKRIKKKETIRNTNAGLNFFTNKI